jgi:hypothetical protein
LFVVVGAVKSDLVEMLKISVLDTAGNYDLIIFHSCASISELADD